MILKFNLHRESPSSNVPMYKYSSTLSNLGEVGGRILIQYFGLGDNKNVQRHHLECSS